VIGFSSAGPSRATGGDLIKPDITAPGVDVVAAVPPIANPTGSFYDLKSGTSMAAPHVAGLAALLRQEYPTWTPNAVKSAIMTSAGQTDNQGRPISRIGAGDATPFDMGSGHIRPGSAFDPGLVYDSGPLEWLQWTCGVGKNLKLGDGSSVCSAVGSIDPSDLNYPSIGIGGLAGTQTVTRTVTNTTNQASVYVAKVQAPPGVTVKVTPSVLTVLPRRSATYTVEFTRTSAAMNSYVSGSITLADLRGHSVRSPFSIKPVAMSGPTVVTGTGTSGSQQVKVRAGFNGTATATAFGLVAPVVSTAHLIGNDEDRFDYNAPAASSTARGFSFGVPAGAKLTRFSTYADDYPAGTDIDLYVFQVNGNTLVNRWLSNGATSDESVEVGPGNYLVYVVQHATAPTVNEQDVKLYAHLVDGTNAGNFSVTPASQAVTVGREVTFTVNWSGLTAGTRYLGVIEYGDGVVATGDKTVVSVST
jgi:subtilisin family serine protease